MEIAAALEAYKTSNGFYVPLNSKAGTIGSAKNANSYRIICSNGNNELLDFDEYKFIPELHCPLGDVRMIGVSGNVTVDTVASYGIRLRNEEYSLRCFRHNVTVTRYVHLKGQPAGWSSYDEDNFGYVEEQGTTYWGQDDW